MASRRKGSYADVNRVRRMFRALPKAISQEVRTVVEETAKAIERDAKAFAPAETGDLRRSISSKVGRDGFTAQIGIRGKRAQRRAYYAHFVEFGTRAYSPGQVRGASGSKTTHKVRKVVAARRAQPFLYPAAQVNKKAFFNNSRRALKRALTLARRIKG